MFFAAVIYFVLYVLHHQSAGFIRQNSHIWNSILAFVYFVQDINYNLK